MRIARRLADLPEITAAFGRGELSYSKVRALCRFAEPETDAGLADMARYATGSQLERLASGMEAADRACRDRSREPSSLSVWTDDHGYVCVKGRFTPTDGELVQNALHAAMEAAALKNDRDGSAERPELTPGGHAAADATVRDGSAEPSERSQRQADALVNLVTGDEADRWEAVIHLDEAAACGHDDGVAETATGRGVPVSEARRVLCDATRQVLVTEAESGFVTGGRRMRTVNRALRRALQRRDRGCVFPGCDQTRWVDAHHIVHWADGGRTDLDNLVLLCRRHHRAVHERGYRIVSDPQTEPIVILGPDHETLSHASAHLIGHPDDLDRLVHAADIHPDTCGLLPGGGWPMDLSWAISVLADQREEARHQRLADAGRHGDPVDTSG